MEASTAKLEKTLNYLGESASSTPRLIVAAKYLNDGRLTLIDRNNSVLLITNTTDETTQEIDLAGPLFPHERVPVPEPSSCTKEMIIPSDVNNGFDDHQLLITFRGETFSFGVIYTTETKQNELVLEKRLTVKVKYRTRSIVVLGMDHFCATTEEIIVILNKSGDRVAEHDRDFCDKGGFMMSDYSDGVARFFYGDGKSFVRCDWDGTDITVKFRVSHTDMMLPRGSVIDGSGGIIVCCESKNIFRISLDGNQSKVITFDVTKSFGDLDFCPNDKVFITTFWEVNEFPILFKIQNVEA